MESQDTPFEPPFVCTFCKEVVADIKFEIEDGEIIGKAACSNCKATWVVELMVTDVKSVVKPEDPTLVKNSFDGIIGFLKGKINDH